MTIPGLGPLNALGGGVDVAQDLLAGDPIAAYGDLNVATFNVALPAPAPVCASKVSPSCASRCGRSSAASRERSITFSGRRRGSSLRRRPGSRRGAPAGSHEASGHTRAATVQGSAHGCRMPGSSNTGGTIEPHGVPIVFPRREFTTRALERNADDVVAMVAREFDRLVARAGWR